MKVPVENTVDVLGYLMLIIFKGEERLCVAGQAKSVPL